MQEETFSLLVDRVIQETARVKTFRLRPEQGDLPFRFAAGQHMGVIPRLRPPSDDLPPEKWCHFSLSSSAENRAFAEITVLDQGKASHAMHGLRPGDAVEVTRPVGSFTLEEPAGHGPVFFGAGIGVAPIRSMLRTSLDRDLGEEITLFLRFSFPGEGLFVETFQEWARQSPRLRFWVHYSRTPPTEERPSGTDPFHDPAWFRERIQHPSERTCYLCLPPGLRDLVRNILVRAGVPPERIRAETW